MDVARYLKKQGYDTVPSSFYRLIDMWESWYQSKVRKFHSYKIYNGDTHVNQQRYSLGMAKKVCEDIADLLMNEKVKITISDKTTQDFVEHVLKDNRSEVMLNQYQERKAYTGTVAYVPYIDNAEISEDEGSFISGTGTIKINFVSAGRIYPLSWSNGYISECAFVFIKTVDSVKYSHIQIHRMEPDEYVIENHVVECSTGAGREIPVEDWKNITGFENLAPEIHTGSKKRQFTIDSLNIVNNTDEDNPMGVALFANCIDQLKGIDVVYDSYVNEFVLGKKRIFVAPEMMGTNVNGSPVFDDNDVVFYRLPEDTLKDGGKPIFEVNMEIRADQHNKAINDILNIISAKCGFGTEHYKFENGSIQTATQVISENSDMYRTIKKHEIPLDAILKELIRIICRLGNVLGAGVKEDAEITIDFDDSIIEDKSTERQQDRNDVSMGVMRHEEYRAKWYGETVDEAARNLPEQNVTMPDDVKVK